MGKGSPKINPGATPVGFLRNAFTLNLVLAIFIFPPLPSLKCDAGHCNTPIIALTAGAVIRQSHKRVRVVWGWGAGRGRLAAAASLCLLPEEMTASPDR